MRILHMQAAPCGAEDGDAICADLLTARWGEQTPGALVDKGPCEAFLPCLSWAAETSGQPQLSPALTPITAPLMCVQLFCMKVAQDSTAPCG